jgi:DNA-binding transcriptional regulator YiaG
MTAARIRAILASTGMTQGELADAVGVGIRAVRHWLEPEGAKGYRRPSGPSLKALERIEREASKRSSRKNPKNSRETP